MRLVHANTHVAFGVIITTLISIVLPLSVIEFLLAICGAFVQDVDFLLSKFAPDENHRLLITHSIWPGVVAIAAGFPLALPWVVVAGINSISHVFIDSIDWGVTLIGRKTLFGPKILYRGKNPTLKEIREQYLNPQCYFTLRWYRNPLMRILEGMSTVGMAVALILIYDPFRFLALVFYGVFACLHYSNLLQCLHREKMVKGFQP